MNKKQWYTIEIEGRRGTTTIRQFLNDYATSEADAKKSAIERYKNLNKDTAFVTIKKCKKW